MTARVVCVCDREGEGASERARERERERERPGGVADDGEGPVEAVADGDEEEVLGEKVEAAGPLGHVGVPLLGRSALGQGGQGFRV